MHEPKSLVACISCREKKIRCRGGFPCEKCIALKKECSVMAPRRARRHVEKERTALLEERLSQMECLLRTRTISESPSSGNNLGPPSELGTSPMSSRVLQPTLVSPGMPVKSQSYPGVIEFPQPHPTAPAWPKDQISPTLHYEQQDHRNSECHVEPLRASQTLLSLSNAYPSPQKSLHPEPSIDQNSFNEKEQIDISPQKANWEHMGPSSWITICSQPGLKWVAEQSGTQDFAECAKGLTLSWSQRLKFRGLQHREPPAELDCQTAWLYTKAYFDDSLEALYGVVYRPEFEALLKEHFSGTLGDDASWYALRNVVYATGCRTYLAKQNPRSWTEAQRRSWPFFENALSVYVDLLYTPTNLLAVRALAAMNFHIEGAGNPALESMMCISAVRLAQTKGLHRQPASSWDLSQDEILHRNWLWCAIYVHEKQVAHRSGRPSVVDEDNISCQVPSTIVRGSTLDIQFLTILVHFSRISAQICRQLLSVSGFRQTPAVIMERMSELSQRLETWKSSLPFPLQPGSPISSSGFRTTRDLNRALCIHFAYYGSLTAIHTIFFCPWISFICGIDPHDVTHNSQIIESTKIVAEAARQIIRATKAIEIDATSPQWLVFYFPMVGLINLFLYILKYPASSSAAGDVSMLDVAVGHFGLLEVTTTSELSYPFAREVARIAYQTVKSRTTGSARSTRAQTPATAVTTSEMTDNNVTFQDEINGVGMPAIDLDSFNIFESLEFPCEGEMIYFNF